MRDKPRATKTVDGKRVYARGDTYEEARRNLRKKIDGLDEVEESREPYDNWFWDYLDTYKAGIKDDTRKNYISIYTTSIKPKIGSKPIKNIKQADCIGVLNSLTGKSKSYVHKAYILLFGSLESAKNNDLIRKNPMQAVTEPSAGEGHRRPLTPRERELFLQAADNCGEAGYFCKLMYYCGLRPSEAARVKAEDFDRELRILTVHEGKTKNAARRIGVPKVCPLPEKEKGYLFVSKNGRTRNRDGQREYWLKVKLEMERIADENMADDLVMYCLRHDYGTRCVEAGVEIETISKTMGHSNAGFTSKIYLHPTDLSVLNALGKLDALYGE